MKEKCTKIINGILITILGIVLFANLFILFQAKANKDNVPAIFGYKPFIVMSGSMESEIYTGDLIFVKTVDTEKLKENDTIAFRTKEDKVVTHRIIGISIENNETYYTTKGDNNATKDREKVNAKDVEGKYILRIPKLGKWLLFISKPIGVVVSVLIAFIIILVYAFINMGLDKKEKEKEDEEYRKEFEEFKKEHPHKK